MSEDEPLQDENSKREPSIRQTREFRERMIEIYVWAFIAACFMLYPTLITFSQGDSRLLGKVYVAELKYVLIGLFILFFPILTRLIFGVTPFESTRNYVRYNRFIPVTITNTQIANHINDKPFDTDIEREYSLICIQESDKIAEKIYSRSGVYLFVGCLIAFMGVGIFSLLFTTTKTTTNEATWDRVLDYLPRFGSLFFIEYIAFFFLKQYRVIQEEYRYYEGIKRRRQDTYNFVGLIVKHKLDKDVITILKESYKEGQSTVLKKGETTQVLEVQKLSSEETAIFSKFIDAIKEFKSADRKSTNKSPA